ncbi:hypothetical protein ACFQV4_29740 [Streptomyces thermocarboxydus]
MGNETAEQNRYQRALSAQISAYQAPSTGGQASFREFNGKVLLEHPRPTAPPLRAAAAASPGRAGWQRPPCSRSGSAHERTARRHRRR